MTEEIADDTTRIYFGKYKGKCLGEIPCSYLVWMHDECNNLTKPIENYLKKNIKLLRKEAEQEQENADWTYPDEDQY